MDEQKSEQEIKGEAVASLSRVSASVEAELALVTDKPGSEAAGQWKSALQVMARLLSDEIKAQGV